MKSINNNVRHLANTGVTSLFSRSLPVCSFSPSPSTIASMQIVRRLSGQAHSEVKDKEAGEEESEKDGDDIGRDPSVYFLRIHMQQRLQEKQQRLQEEQQRLQQRLQEEQQRLQQRLQEEQQRIQEEQQHLEVSLDSAVQAVGDVKHKLSILQEKISSKEKEIQDLANRLKDKKEKEMPVLAADISAIVAEILSVERQISEEEQRQSPPQQQPNIDQEESIDEPTQTQVGDLRRQLKSLRAKEDEKVAADTVLRDEIKTLGKRITQAQGDLQHLKMGMPAGESALEVAQKRELEIRKQLKRLITNHEIGARNAGLVDTEAEKKNREEAKWKLQWTAIFGAIFAVFATIIAGLFALATSNIASPVLSYFFIAKRFLWDSIMTDEERATYVRTSQEEELSRSAYTDAGKYHLVYGTKGIGKTAAAKSYAENLRKAGYPVTFISPGSDDTATSVTNFFKFFGYFGIDNPKKGPTIATLFEKCIAVTRWLRWKKRPVIIIDNVNAFAKSEEGRFLLAVMQGIAKLVSDSGAATFIFVTSEGDAVPLMYAHTGADRMNGVYMSEMPHDDAKKVMTRHLQIRQQKLKPVSGELPPMWSDELMDAIIKVTGGSMSALRTIVGEYPNGDAHSALHKVVGKWESTIEKEVQLILDKVPEDSKESMKRLYQLADEVCATAATDPSRNIPVEHYRALSILSGLSEQILGNLEVKAPWTKELERILATNVLGRVNDFDVGLQFRGQRFAWAPILAKMLPETTKTWALSQTAKDRTTAAACLEEKEKLFHRVAELQMQYTASRTDSEKME